MILHPQESLASTDQLTLIDSGVVPLMTLHLVE
jgi:hypothetical protein